MPLTKKIKQKALELNFDLAAITDASPIQPDQIDYFSNWLKKGFAADMGYLHRNFEKRVDPQKLFPPAKSVIIVAVNYKCENLPEKPADKLTGKVSDYALYPDYHNFIKTQLRKLALYIDGLVDDFEFKICVDSVPLAERSLAARSGLGLLGKNHMIINPILGCQLFLGELITNIPLPSDAPLKNNICQNCDLCIKACPTSALSPDGNFDAAKCISYLTIEHQGQIPQELADKFNDSLFGCDRCSNACPYHKKAPASSNSDFKPDMTKKYISLDAILNMTQQQFDNDFKGTSLHRTGLQNLKRNALICKNNFEKK